MSGRKVFGLVGGATVGLLLGLLAYTVGAPLLEESGGLLREAQGLLWNLVPLLTVVGAFVGLWSAGRREP